MCVLALRVRACAGVALILMPELETLNVRTAVVSHTLQSRFNTHTVAKCSGAFIKDAVCDSCIFACTVAKVVRHLVIYKLTDLLT